MGGVDAKDGSWPWQVDIQVGPSETLTILCACRKLHVLFSVVYQTDLLREGFACDAEVTHSLSFFFLPLASRQTLMVISVEAPSSQRTGSCQPLIVSPSKKNLLALKSHQVDFHLSTNPQPHPALPSSIFFSHYFLILWLCLAVSD